MNLLINEFYQDYNLKKVAEYLIKRDGIKWTERRDRDEHRTLNEKKAAHYIPTP